MPLRLDIKRRFSLSGQIGVKGVDLHPTEAVVFGKFVTMGTFTSGTQMIRQWSSPFEVTELPVRTGQILWQGSNGLCVARMTCFIRVYNYNTMDKVKAFEAHNRLHQEFGCASNDALLCCPHQMTCSSSCGIGTRVGCVPRCLKDTSHYVMQVVFQPQGHQHLCQCQSGSHYQGVEHRAAHP
eukprot:jgi/Botrbrau1/11046/Bobra.92_2s0017.1